VGSLEDQLKQWKRANAAAPAKAETRPTKAASSAKSTKPTQAKKASSKTAPPLQTIRRADPPPPPPPPALSDAELFAAAVQGIDDNASLEKFAAAPAPIRVNGAPLSPSPPKSDEELFAAFVGRVAKAR